MFEFIRCCIVFEVDSDEESVETIGGETTTIPAFYDFDYDYFVIKDYEPPKKSPSFLVVLNLSYLKCYYDYCESLLSLTCPTYNVFYEVNKELLLIGMISFYGNGILLE